MKDLLISALKLSGSLLLDCFRKPLEVNVKESHSSIVTDADIKSENLIINLIHKKFPGHNIISEECGYMDHLSEYTWVIDPLDGTSNFAAQLPWFGVMITLFRHNEPFMAGAYLPVTDELFFAEKGKGSLKNGKALIMKASDRLENSLIAFSVDYSDDELFFNRGIEMYRAIVRGSRNIRCTNSLVDFLYVAEGRIGAAINLYTKIWDTSGLGLIISEAGGIMLDLDGNVIEYSVSGQVLDRNFPVAAGSEKILNALNIFIKT